MNPKLLELATRHGALQARIDEQRRTLARHTQPLQAAFAKGDAVVDGVDWLKQHPGVVGGGRGRCRHPAAKARLALGAAGFPGLAGLAGNP